MAWVALDDKFPHHPKIMALTDAEFRTWASALAYSQMYRTRGHIQKTSLQSIPRATPKIAASLVNAGLWHNTDDGWVIHDWDEYNPERRLKSDRQQRWRDGATNGEEKPAPRWQREDTPQSRQSFYASAEWRRTRPLIFDRDQGVCAVCDTQSDRWHADHLEPLGDILRRDGDPFDITNIQTLCATCHGRKTGVEKVLK